MFDILKIRRNHGKQYIPDDKKAVIPLPFRGFPVISNGAELSFNPSDVCPTGALAVSPLSIDLGKCIFCGDCAGACSNNEIVFSNRHKLSADTRDKLVITADMCADDYEAVAVQCKSEIKRMFGRSLKLREVCAGGCSGCELELNACGNVNFDIGRFGIEFTASPRHADGLVVTGPVTENMAYALEEAYLAIPDPKILIAVGACAISGGLFADSPAVSREFFKKHRVDLFIPGCPVHPLTFVNGVITFIGR